MSVKSICPKCHSSFLCGKNDTKCWCNEISLSETTLKEIASIYSGCLCPTCLYSYKITKKV
ncbi:MAG: cysteine-rich CWC family protein [Candidatus Thorarchaeota archaeon]